MNSRYTKDFLIVTLINFFIILNFYLLVVIISVFAMESFNSTPSEAGLATSIFVIGALVARLFSGKWIEQIGRKKMLYTGLILGLAMTLLYLGINGVKFLIAIRFLHGVAYGIASTATGTIVANIIPKERRGEGLGYFMLSVTLAMAIGPFLGIFISQHGSFNMLFIACAISAALSLVSASFLSVPEIILTKEQIEEMKGFKLNNIFEAKAIPISIVCAVLYVSYSSVISFLAAYTKEIHLVDAASFFFIVVATVIFISRPFTGRLFDSKGENFIMYPAFLIFMMGMIILSQTHHGYTLLLSGAFIGFGLGVIQSSGQAIAVKETSQHRLGLANSTYFILLDLGVGIGPFILGKFIPFTGYRGIYIAMAIVAFACIFLYYLLHGKKAVPKKIEKISAGR
ncbi:MAG: MFS transporter [Carboxydocellales bacterium]